MCNDCGVVMCACSAECENVVDVSALSHVRRLNLSRCMGVVSVAALVNVGTLDLSWCRKEQDWQDGLDGEAHLRSLGHVHIIREVPPPPALCPFEVACPAPRFDAAPRRTFALTL